MAEPRLWVCVAAVIFCAVTSGEEETELQKWRSEIVQHLFGYDLHLMRQRRQTSCGVDEFPCKQEPQCIKTSQVCDGEIHCPDKSDESFTLCSQMNFTCPGYAYQCSYGACVDGKAMCNGEIECADQSDELQPECEGIKSQADKNICEKLQFACLNGEQCIDMSRLCDGFADCDDATDETITACSRVHCQNFTFRCSYGACVDGDAPCDGTAQCHDGSDEFAPGCKYFPPSLTDLHINGTEKPSQPPREPPVRPERPTSTRNPCLLPAVPDNGTFTSYWCEPGSKQPECLGVEGSKVPQGFTLHYECFAGFGLRGNADITCRNGNWYPQLPSCTDKCDPLVSNKLLISCNTEKYQSLDCSKPLPANSRASFRCEPSSYMAVLDPGYSRITCVNGEWDKPLIENFCQPVCGRAVDDDLAVPVVSHGKKTEYGQFPWHAGIFEIEEKTKQYELLCGGSLISTKVVISAAHCFYYEVPGYREIFAKNISSLRVAAGKYYRTFKAPKDTLMQESAIKSIEIGPEYRATLSFFSDDIAFVVLEKEFTFSYAVRPVCIDVGKQSFEEDQLVRGAIGQVVGWGLTNTQLPSDSLLLAEMPFVPREDCVKSISSKLINYITYDKICAGDKRSKTSVCPGDSGGGLVFYYEPRKAFYLRGVVSLGTKGCKGQDYALFTKLSHHRDYVEKFMAL